MRDVRTIELELATPIARREAESTMALVHELEQIDSPKARCIAMRTRADVLRWAGEYKEALSWYEQALSLSRELNDDGSVAIITANMGILYWSTGERPKAIAMWTQALDAHSRRGDTLNTARVHMNLGTAALSMGDLASGLVHYTHALDATDIVEEPMLRANAFSNIGIIYRNAGDVAVAHSYFLKAYDLQKATQNRSGMISSELNFAWVHDSLGERQTALEHAERALELCIEMGDRPRIAFTRSSIGEILADMGEVERSMEHYRIALEDYKQLGEPDGVANTATAMATLLLRSSCNEEVLRLLDLVDGITIDDVSLHVRHGLNRARACIAVNDVDGAHRSLQACLDVATTSEMRPMQLRVHEVWRALALAQRDLDAYVKHTEAFIRLQDEMRGADAAKRVATLDAQRTIDAERAEKERHRSLLYTTLPPDIAERVLRGEKVNDAFDNVAVLFMDLAGFTTMASSMPPDDVVSLLSTIFTACDAIVAEHRLTKIKTIGDAYMAVAFPEKQADGETDGPQGVAERAARAARAMLHAVSPEGSPAGSPVGSPAGLRVRIGLHCGPVTAGIIGTERLQYDVWGDTVNVASRMESTGEPGRIHVSEAFAREMRNVPDMQEVLRERGEVDVKGKGRMTTYWLSSEAPTSSDASR